MEISDALPIQFWPFIKRITSGVQTLRVLFWDEFSTNLIYGPNYGEWNTPTTFNELQNRPGMTDAFYIGPKDFADDIIIQFRAAPGGVYVFHMIREDWHAFIFNQSIPEISSGLYQVTVSGSAQAKDAWGRYQFSICSPVNLATANILSAIGAAWTNQSDGGENWTVGAGSAAVILTDVSANSNRLLTTFTDTDVDKTYVFNISGTVSGTPGEDGQGYILLKFYHDGAEVEGLRRRCPIIFNRNQNHTYSSVTNFSFKIVIPDLTLYQVDAIAVSSHLTYVDTAGSGFIVTLSTGTASKYESNGLVYQKSDHYDCYWGEWDEMEQGGYYGHIYGNQRLTPTARQTKSTVLIKYQNTDEFAGLDFSSSPGPEMYLRVPGRFVHESFPTEQEVHELSSNEFVQVWSEQTRKVMLEVSHVPYYMHNKILLALSCDYVNVGAIEHVAYPENDAAGDNAGVDVVRRDVYNINDGDKRYPLKTATVLLTDKESISRNLI